MHAPNQLEKQQVGLRLPKYMIEDVDELTERFSLNRTDIITEALRSYIAQQKEKMFYDQFREGVRELKGALDGKREDLVTLDELIDELDDH